MISCLGVRVGRGRPVRYLLTRRNSVRLRWRSHRWHSQLKILRTKEWAILILWRDHVPTVEKALSRQQTPNLRWVSATLTQPAQPLIVPLTQSSVMFAFQVGHSVHLYAPTNAWAISMHGTTDIAIASPKSALRISPLALITSISQYTVRLISMGQPTCQCSTRCRCILSSSTQWYRAIVHFIRRINQILIRSVLPKE